MLLLLFLYYYYNYYFYFIIIIIGQVGSMSALKTQSGRSTVLVSQPGGSYVELICSGEELTTSDSINNESSNKSVFRIDNKTLKKSFIQPLLHHLNS